jgi:hypothetical protein
MLHTVHKLKIVTYRRDHFRQNCHDRMAAECQVRLIGLSMQGHTRPSTMAVRYLHLVFLFLCYFLTSLVLGMRNFKELSAEPT